MKSDGADLRAVHHLRVVLTLTHRHATAHSEMILSSKPFQGVWRFGDELGPEANVAVTRHQYGPLTEIALEGLALAVAGVDAGYRFMTLVTEVFAQLRFKCLHHQQLGQLLEQAFSRIRSSGLLQLASRLTSDSWGTPCILLVIVLTDKQASASGGWFGYTHFCTRPPPVSRHAVATLPTVLPRALLGLVSPCHT